MFSVSAKKWPNVNYSSLLRDFWCPPLFLYCVPRFYFWCLPLFAFGARLISLQVSTSFLCWCPPLFPFGVHLFCLLVPTSFHFCCPSLFSVGTHLFSLLVCTSFQFLCQPLFFHFYSVLLYCKYIRPYINVLNFKLCNQKTFSSLSSFSI